MTIVQFIVTLSIVALFVRLVFWWADLCICLLHSGRMGWLSVALAIPASLAIMIGYL